MWIIEFREIRIFLKKKNIAFRKIRILFVFRCLKYKLVGKDLGSCGVGMTHNGALQVF